MRYRVPDHQDPTVLLAALGKQGYQATSVYEHAVTTLTVRYTGRRAEQRARIREILAGVHNSTLGGPELIYGPVRFEDEAGERARAVPPAERARLQALTEQPAAIEPAPQRTIPTGPAPLIRAAWGAVLLAGTDTVCRTIALPPTSRSRLVVRALGARHLAHAGVTAAAPSRRTLLIGAAVDSAQALTAVVYAGSGPGQRRAGLASAGVATAFALDGVRRARRAG